LAESSHPAASYEQKRKTRFVDEAREDKEKAMEISTNMHPNLNPSSSPVIAVAAVGRL
jgi:hypothetical protein